MAWVNPKVSVANRTPDLNGDFTFLLSYENGLLLLKLTSFNLKVLKWSKGEFWDCLYLVEIKMILHGNFRFIQKGLWLELRFNIAMRQKYIDKFVGLDYTSESYGNGS